MAGIKISALPAVASALTTDYFPVVQGGITSRETVAQVQTLFGFSTGLLALANGGTNANLTAALGAVPYSTATAFAFLAPGSAGQLFRSGGAGAPTWTTSTYPAANAINTLLYASSANVMAALATANSAVLSTGAGGIPVLSSVLPGGLTTTDPTLTQGIATKNYVDQTALNGTSVYAASAASLGTVTQAGAGVGATLTNAGVQATFALDGVNPPVGSNVLIKDTAVGMAAPNEGIYTVTSVGSGATNWVLTRATSYDSTTEINNTGLIIVNNGSTLAGTAWYNSTTIVTVDTTAFSYSQYGSLFANAGANTNITSMTGLTGTLQAPTGIKSSAGLNLVTFTYTGSAVNYLNMTNRATTGAPFLSATGSDASVSLGLGTKNSDVVMFDSTATVAPGLVFYNAAQTFFTRLKAADAQASTVTFTLPAADGSANFVMKTNGSAVLSLTNGSQIAGTATNDNASAGNIGEYISSSKLVGAAVALTTATNADITTISLTAGDWDVAASVLTNPAAGTVTQYALAAISQVSVTLPTQGAENNSGQSNGATATLSSCVNVGPMRISLASTTTIYLVANVGFTISTMGGYGFIGARRVR